MKCEIKKDCNNVQNRIFEEIINGIYPAKNVSRLNVENLENLTARLVEFTTVTTGAKIQSTPEKSITNWFPWNINLFTKSFNKNDIKEFRNNLIKVVINCCDLIRKYNIQWLPKTRSWINDENVAVIQSNTGKRKLKNSTLKEFPSKRRKTLLPLVNTNFKSKSHIEITRNGCMYTEVSKSLTQSEFLNIFKLGLNNNSPPQLQMPNIYKKNCIIYRPHIPFSSNIGRLLLKKNHNVPAQPSERKQEKLEWYLNKDVSEISNLNYKVTYVANKNVQEHFYNFPVRQYWQTLSSSKRDAFVIKFLKPLKVVVKNENLVNLKKQHDKFNVKIKIPRLSDCILRKYRCKEAKDIEKNECNKNICEVKQLKILLVNHKILR